MDRCTEACTRETTGHCALCDVLAERDRFIRLWMKGGFLGEALRAVQRGFSRAPQTQHAVVRRSLIAVWHHGAFETLAEVLAPAFVHHTSLTLATQGATVAGLEGVRREVTAWREAFPDLRLTLETVLVAGDTVVVRWTGRGTHQGVCLGQTPTGQPVTWTGISLYRVAQGHIMEQWTAEDGLHLSHQLGLG